MRRRRSDGRLYFKCAYQRRVLAGSRQRLCIDIGERPSIGNSSKNVIMVGLRGVGETVLLDKMRLDAEASGQLYLLRTLKD